MSRYRKIEVRTWADERFRSLSPMPPSGQGLWFFLLTGPHTGPIPGLFRAGRAAMAEELDWSLESFDKAFQEVFGNGMAKADFKARLVWLPNALKHNKPESPNVVRSWRVELDLLPECDLKNEAIAKIREMLETVGESYVAAFDEVLSGDKPKAISKPSAKPSTKTLPNQEQEQEQKQEGNSKDSGKDNLGSDDAKQPRAARSGQNTGTRLPEDWVLPSSWGKWAMEERPELTADIVRKEAEKFKDHWLANANRREGKKADWLATWRNWIRNVVLPKNGASSIGGNGSLKPWFITANGIQLKGDEAGIPRPSNDAEFPAYKTRVHKHYGITEEQLRMASIDHGARA
jgi:hypothetical protein